MIQMLRMTRIKFQYLGHCELLKTLCDVFDTRGSFLIFQIDYIMKFGNVRLLADANAIADELRNITVNSPGSRDGFDRGRDSHSGDGSCQSI